MSPVVEAEVVIRNRLGLHARPAAAFVKVANRYHSEIAVRADGVQVNGKSIMGVMMLGAPLGARLFLKADGEDAEALIRELVQLVDNKFNEDS